jgi:hypothetical protein
MRFVRTLAALASVAVLSMNSVEAGVIAGSQGFSFSSVRVTAPSGTSDITTATQFDLRGVTTNDSVNGAFSQDGTPLGDPVATPAVSFGNLPFNTTVGTGLSFGNSSFGFFASSRIQKVNNNLYHVFGHFNPGSLFPGLTANEAEFDIALSQAGGAGNAISGSATLIVPPINNNIVPEPSTMAFAALTAGWTVVAARRRRNRICPQAS